MTRSKKELPPARIHRITIRLTDDMFEAVSQDEKSAKLSVEKCIR